MRVALGSEGRPSQYGKLGPRRYQSIVQIYWPELRLKRMHGLQFDTRITVMHIAAARSKGGSRFRWFLGEYGMLLDEVKTVVGSALQLGDRIRHMNEGTALLGAVPELDSIAVVSLITALEERFDITVADDEIGAAAFETLGSLTRFVESKLAG